MQYRVEGNTSKMKNLIDQLSEDARNIVMSSPLTVVASEVINSALVNEDARPQN